MESDKKSYSHRPRKEATLRTMRNNFAVWRGIYGDAVRIAPASLHGSVGGAFCGKRRHPVLPCTQMCWRGLQLFVATELFILS
jgi:hypothetical protein